MNNQTILHPAVTSVAVAVLTEHGVAKKHHPAALALIAALAIEEIEGKSGRGPKTLYEWQRLVERTAARCAVERLGKAPVRYPYDCGITDDHAELAPWDPWCDPRDGESTACQLAIVREMVERGEIPQDTRRILELLIDGKSIPAIARRLGLSIDEVRRLLRQTRARCFRRFELAAQLVRDAEAWDALVAEVMDRQKK